MPAYIYQNSGQKINVSLSTVAQMPSDSLRSTRDDVILSQASDESASNVKFSLI